MVRSFQEKVNALKGAGFTVTSTASGATRVIRGGYALDLRESGGDVVVEDRAGVLMGDEIGVLVDGGYQKFFRTPSGKKRPALADDLKALHDFEEDVKESLGMKSLYNEVAGNRVDAVSVRSREGSGSRRAEARLGVGLPTS